MFFPFSTMASDLCPEGYWDLGPGAAALAIECVDSDLAYLRFCKREVLLKHEVCNHIGMSVTCRPDGVEWRCEGENRFTARVSLKEDSLTYTFKSSFNSGEFTGRRLTLRSQ